ncbi:MAG TPA: 23S rRNA (adenine(2030)-N(6))-methyltransferase RlmJ [Rhizomicrobium sp.]|jgi:23S rRNA (adenine2030-N6)-methyltransferase|nr:23S rRNA (adenine(2030)-N(6))-methyltransferase RlmJ [Rhizomicrobium sp.]
MNYRHIFHAGNFADVVKHLALVSAIAHLKKKDRGFVVIDTHGGRGLYNLESHEASRTKESETGIEMLAKLSDETPLIAEYLKLARAFGETRYPGSPLIAAQLLREQDRLVAIEKHDEEARELSRVLKPYERARVFEGDGYERLVALMPPQERRGLVLIDPPYEEPNEFGNAAKALGEAYRRFATGIYLLWFPIKSKADANAFIGEVLGAGMAKALRIDIDIGAIESKRADSERMHRAGLLVINPPFGLDTEMREAARVIQPALSATIKIDVLAG